MHLHIFNCILAIDSLHTKLLIPFHHRYSSPLQQWTYFHTHARTPPSLIHRPNGPHIDWIGKIDWAEKCVHRVGVGTRGIHTTFIVDTLEAARQRGRTKINHIISSCTEPEWWNSLAVNLEWVWISIAESKSQNKHSRSTSSSMWRAWRHQIHRNLRTLGLTLLFVRRSDLNIETFSSEKLGAKKAGKTNAKHSTVTAIITI